MLLSLSTVPVYLASRGHLRTKRWLDGSCALSEALGQHRNFVVQSREGRGIFLKQLRSSTPELLAAQENEGMFLAALQELECWKSQRAVTPRLLDLDRPRHLLLIEYFAGKSFYEAVLSVASVKDAERITKLSHDIGVGLARFHRCGRRAIADLGHPKLSRQLPVAITMRPPDPDFFSKLSPACQQIIESIQNDIEFFQHLQANQSHWHCETVIHGDLKWDNLIIADDTDAEFKFIDWELVACGDPAWDVAGVLQSFLVHQVDQARSQESADFSNHRLDAETFWSAYLEYAHQSCDVQFADRVQRYCAARIVQTALEREFQSDSLSTSGSQLISVGRALLCQQRDPTASLGSLLLQR